MRCSTAGPRWCSALPVQRRSELHRADDVGEQHRQLSGTVDKFTRPNGLVGPVAFRHQPH